MPDLDPQPLFGQHARYAISAACAAVRCGVDTRAARHHLETAQLHVNAAERAIFQGSREEGIIVDHLHEMMMDLRTQARIAPRN
jgi:hypothetical protein